MSATDRQPPLTPTEATPAAPSAVSVQGPIVTSPRTPLVSRPVAAIAALLAVAVVAERVPALAPLRVLSPRVPASDAAATAPPAPPQPSALATGEAVLELPSENREELAQPEHVELPTGTRGPIARAEGAAPPIDVQAPPVPVVDAGHRGLGGFFRALERTERQEAGAITRVVFFGDSLVTSDYVTGTLRRKLQGRFGDAGHGFVLLASAWPAYFHNDVTRFSSAGWAVSRIVGPLSPDGWYGLGGVTFRAPPGSRARFGTAKTGKFGRAVSRFTLSYLEQPGGGTFELRVDGQTHGRLETAGPAPVVRRHTITVPDGEHEFEVVTVAGTSRGFGVTLEREGPGVVLDAIGIQGARVRFLDQQEDAHWASELRARQPALLVYMYGANESGDGFAYPMAEYQRTLQAVLRQGLAAVPDAGCLVVGAMDRAEKKGTALSTMAVIPALVEEQRKAAAEVGCAFWNTYQAMGGPGSMAAWVQRGLGQGDLTHPTGSGSEVLASWLERALLAAYADWRGSGRSP